MTHAEILAHDIMDFCRTNYDDATFDLIESKLDLMVSVINQHLYMKPPGATLDMDYRVSFIKGFAETFCMTL